MMKKIFLLFIFVIVACSPQSKDMTIPPMQQYVLDDDDNVQYFDPKVDILFVIDNSGSMEELAASVDQFLQQVLE